MNWWNKHKQTVSNIGYDILTAIIGGLFFGLLGFVLAITATKAHAQDLPLNAQSALVIDAHTNEIILQKNPDEVRPIASITKLMTAVITLDANLPLDEEITISQEEVDATMLRHRQTSRSLPIGVKLTRAELLHLALMNSQNRAASALARSYPGGPDAFVAAMNNKAQMLGMVNTRYVDPTGLYNQNVSTAAELAILVRHASDYVYIRDFSTATAFELTMYNKKRHKTVAFGTTNMLIRNHNWQIYLQKTGYIQDAGRCVVMRAAVGAKEVIIVLLNATSSQTRATDAIRIKHWVETGNILPMIKSPIYKHKKARRA